MFRIFCVKICAASYLFILISAMPALADSKFQDPLDYPAKVRTSVNSRPLMAIASAGNALVAVGSRGLIIRSTDDGKTWNQSSVPVQSDLLAVNFPNSKEGWAVGHDGVILHSEDGGKIWKKELDGRIAGKEFINYYAEHDNDAATKAAAAEIALNYKSGPSLPWLDVWFKDDNNGFVVGSFGMIAATTDGGKTWKPWLDRIDNKQWLNLNCIRGVGDDIYIAGERGMVFKLDLNKNLFKKIATGYDGSFFGFIGNTSTLLAFGLRSTVYRSNDNGLSWNELKIPTEAVATINGASLIPNSSGFALINNEGQILLSDREAGQLKIVQANKQMRYTGGITFAKNNSIVVTGLNGVVSVNSGITSK